MQWLRFNASTVECIPCYLELSDICQVQTDVISCRYQDYQADDIPTVQQDGISVRVMAGVYQGTKGPIVMRNPGLLMDVTVSKGATFSQEVMHFDTMLYAFSCVLRSLQTNHIAHCRVVHDAVMRTHYL